MNRSDRQPTKNSTSRLVSASVRHDGCTTAVNTANTFDWLLGRRVAGQSSVCGAVFSSNRAHLALGSERGLSGLVACGASCSSRGQKREPPQKASAGSLFQDKTPLRELCEAYRARLHCQSAFAGHRADGTRHLFQNATVSPPPSLRARPIVQACPSPSTFNAFWLRLPPGALPACTG